MSGNSRIISERLADLLFGIFRVLFEAIGALERIRWGNYDAQ